VLDLAKSFHLANLVDEARIRCYNLSEIGSILGCLQQHHGESRCHIMPGKAQVSLGELVADFELRTVAGESYTLDQFDGRIVVLVFWSAECPVSTEYDVFFNGLLDRYAVERIVVLGIDSNVNYDQDTIASATTERGVRFPVLRDTDAKIADYFGALTTPHVYIVDAESRLAYAGAVDDRTFRQPEATVNYVDQALEAIVAGQTPPITETQPYGCTIVRHK
jgi:peroxiredoxin